MSHDGSNPSARADLDHPALERRLPAARELDRADPLAPFRQRFALPRDAAGQPLIYLCGHSLGLAPLAARAAIEHELAAWERQGVLGHHRAENPWVEFADALAPMLAELVGAQPHEVVAMNSLSINLHLLLASFYRPRGERRALLIEQGAFSSDRHVVAAQIEWHGLDPAHDLIEVAPRAGEELLRIEDVEAAIAAAGARLALVLWPGVQYRTGQSFDLTRIASAAHAAGAVVGFDLAHSAGNVPLSLHTSQADFAAWCTYKYLNSGPGSLAAAFIHERHLSRPDAPRLAGWWGHEGASRFMMSAQFTPARGAAAWAVSNPPILSSAALRASLPMFAEAGMAALRRKSVALTNYFAERLTEFAGTRLSIITPAEPASRGCQLSVRVRGGAHDGQHVLKELQRAGVVCDWREPDTLRLAPVPLYNSFEDVLRGAWYLARILRAQA